VDRSHTFGIPMYGPLLWFMITQALAFCVHPQCLFGKADNNENLFPTTFISWCIYHCSPIQAMCGKGGDLTPYKSKTLPLGPKCLSNPPIFPVLSKAPLPRYSLRYSLCQKLNYRWWILYKLPVTPMGLVLSAPGLQLINALHCCQLNISFPWLHSSSAVLNLAFKRSI